MPNLLAPVTGQALEDALRRLCATSEPGTAILPERELAKQYEVSVATVRRVMKGLLEDGLIERQQGCGTFVAEVPRPKTKAKLLALYVDTWQRMDHPHRLGNLRGMVGAAPGHNLRLEILECGDQLTEEHRLVEAIEADKPAGVVVPWVTAGLLAVRQRVAPHLPIITTASAHALAEASYVGPDYAAIGSGSARLLGQAGCTRPVGVFVSGVARGAFEAEDEVLTGSQRVLRASTKDLDAAGWAKQIRELEADGLAFDDDVIAAAVLAELGFPEWPVVSAVDSRARTLPDTVARLELDSVWMGREIMRLLRLLIDEPGRPPVSLLVRPRLMETKNMEPVRP